MATKVNLNTANLAELQQLPEVGPTRAQQVIDNRPTGGYEDLDDFVSKNSGWAAHARQTWDNANIEVEFTQPQNGAGGNGNGNQNNGTPWGIIVAAGVLVLVLCGASMLAVNTTMGRSLLNASANIAQQSLAAQTTPSATTPTATVDLVATQLADMDARLAEAEANATQTANQIAVANATATAVAAERDAVRQERDNALDRADAAEADAEELAAELETATADPGDLVVTGLNPAEVLEALADAGAVFYNQHLFGSTWVQTAEPVVADLPEHYNFTVVSTDPAAIAIGDEDPFFVDMREGFLAVIVGTGPIEIREVGFSETSDHRNVSAWSIPVQLEGDDLKSFAAEWAAFEWSREYKPSLLVYFQEDEELYVLHSDDYNRDTVELDAEITLSDLFALPPGD